MIQAVSEEAAMDSTLRQREPSTVEPIEPVVNTAPSKSDRQAGCSICVCASAAVLCVGLSFYSTLCYFRATAHLQGHGPVCTSACLISKQTSCVNQ